MGCWNGTCGLTHLPIQAGQKVRGFFLVPETFGRERRIESLLEDVKVMEQVFQTKDIVKIKELLRTEPESYGGGICYSTGIFHPLSYAVQGDYNDYGSLENVKKNANTKMILSWVNDLIKDGTIIIHEDGFEKNQKPLKKIKTFDDLIRLVCQGCSPFGFMMVLEDAFLGAIQALEDSMTYDTKDWKKDRAEKEFDELATFINNAKKIPPHLACGLLSARNYVQHCLFGYGECPAIEHSFSDYLNKILDEPKVKEHVVNHIQFFRVMNVTRRLWIPQAGAGSQSESYDLHRRIAEQALKHIANLKKKSIQELTECGDFEGPPRGRKSAMH